ncbi:MAG TPA: HAMP domain-containing sensor histidine kinase [Gaiellaceae bacterium]|nr:HAMP domain-containing sensor histidine kinase [Gaiellaceae bacterium]
MSPGSEGSRLAVLVHEVRSPVAALAALAAAAGREGSLATDDLRELARLAVAACLSIERTARDAAVSSVRPADVDPGELVRECVRASVVGGARIRCELGPGLPTLRADPIRLRQALDNLVANALAHSPPDEEVLVSVRADGDAVVFSVRDRGPGVPEGARERIFERGVRLAGNRPGSGLGLWVARTIAEAHGGTLTVRSGAVGGADFVLTLPTHAHPATRASST